MKKGLLTLSLFYITFFVHTVYSQVVNSNNITIAEFYNATAKNFTVNGGKVETQIPLKFPWIKDTFYKIKNTSSDRSAHKKKQAFLDLGLLNTNSFLNLNSFDFDDVGYTLGITFQNSFDKIYVDEDSKETKAKSYKTWKGSVNLRLDRFENFDPTKNDFDNKLPATLEIQLGGSIYCFDFLNFLGVKWTFVPSAFLLARPITNNLSSLDNFVLNSNINSNEIVSFTSNSEFDGKFGVLKNNLQSTLASISFPLVVESGLKKIHLAPIPHATIQYLTDSKPLVKTGISLGILTKPIIGKKIKLEETRIIEKNNKIALPIKDKPDTNKLDDCEKCEIRKKQIKKDSLKGIKTVKNYFSDFNAPSFLSFGVDWDIQSNQSSKPTFFISGTVKF